MMSQTSNVSSLNMSQMSKYTTDTQLISNSTLPTLSIDLMPPSSPGGSSISSFGTLPRTSRKTKNPQNQIYETNCRYTYVEMPNKKMHLLNIGPEIKLIADALKALATTYDVDPSSLDCFYKGSSKPIEVRNNVDAIIGKEIRVERRSVFRLDLIRAKRSIGIRAKWKKTVAEALMSTLPKYGLGFLKVFDLVLIICLFFFLLVATQKNPLPEHRKLPKSKTLHHHQKTNPQLPKTNRQTRPHPPRIDLRQRPRLRLHPQNA